MRIVMALLLAILASIAAADGMMLKVGPQPGVPDLPYQRAVVAFRDGVQTLIVESRLGGGERGDHVWVLPVPAAPERIEEVDQEYLEMLFAAGRPVVDREPKSAVPSEILLGAWVLVVLLGWLCQREPKVLQRILMFVLGSFIVAVIAGVYFPIFGSSTKDLGDLSVGAWDVAALEPERPEDPLAWLRTHGAQVPEASRRVLENYRRRGWSILVMKFVRRTPTQQPHPLRFVFPAAQPVYPMRLTGTATERLVLDLIVIGDRRAEVEGMTRWATAQGKRASGANRFYFRPHVPVASKEASDLWQDCWLTSYRGEFSRRDMERDVSVAWSEPSYYRAEYFTIRGLRRAAMTTFALWGFVAMFVGTMAALLAPRPRVWLPWVLAAALLIGGARAGHLLLTEPVFDASTGRLS